MAPRLQKTFLYKSSTNIVDRLANWAVNPWRRYSLLAIIFLSGFLSGSSLGMINGVLALMDPVGAFIALIFLEVLIQARFVFLKSNKPIILVRVFDMFRIGLAYGLFSEGLKLLFETRKVAGKEIPDCSVVNFEDVREDVWFEEYACLAKEFGLFELENEDQLNASNLSSRGEVVLMLYRLDQALDT